MHADQIGCDKTVPAQLMGGISANKPIIQLITGPMLTGSVRGVRVGACTDCRKNWASFRAGEIEIEDIKEVSEELAPSVCKSRLQEDPFIMSLGWHMWSNGNSKYDGMRRSRPRNDAT
jgi:hypothetical protein